MHLDSDRPDGRETRRRASSGYCGGSRSGGCGVRWRRGGWRRGVRSTPFLLVLATAPPRRSFASVIRAASFLVLTSSWRRPGPASPRAALWHEDFAPRPLYARAPKPHARQLLVLPASASRGCEKNRKPLDLIPPAPCAASPASSAPRARPRSPPSTRRSSPCSTAARMRPASSQRTTGGCACTRTTARSATSSSRSRYPSSPATLASAMCATRPPARRARRRRSPST